jgi:PAS domain S-box-containing protein
MNKRPRAQRIQAKQPGGGKRGEQRREHELWQLVENLSEVIFQTDADGRWTFLNRAWSNITGFAVDETLGCTFLDALHPDDRAQSLDLFISLIAGQRAFCRHEARLLTRAGGSRWIEVFAQPTLDSAGKIQGTAGTVKDITERKQAEERLTKSMATNRALLNAMPDAMFRLSRDGRFVNYRTSSDDLWLPPSEFLGRHVSEVLPSELADIVLQALAEALGGAGLQVFEFQLLIHNQPYDLEARIVVSEIDEVIAIVRDITDRKRAEEALRESEARFRALVNDIDVGVILFGPESDVLLSNPAARSLLGLGDDQLRIGNIRAPARDIFREDGTPFLSAEHPVARAIASRRPVRNVVVGVRRAPGDGLAWLLVNAEPQIAASGELHQIICTFSDITDRKRAEEALRQARDELEQRVIERTFELAQANALLEQKITERQHAERRYRDLFEEAPVQYVITNHQSQEPIVVDCNQAFLETLGYTRAEVIGQPLARFYTGDSSDLLHTGGYQRALRGNFTPEERELVTSDGRVVPTLLRASPEIGPEGRIVGTRAMYMDITDRKQMERALAAERASLAQRVAERTTELSAANAELARAARMKDEFLASMSHELRTPLTAILGLSEALQHPAYGPLSERQRAYLRTIEESGQHLLALINDILDLSKIEAGKITLEKRVLSLETLCHASLRMVRQAAQHKRMSVTLALDTAVELIYADERRLKQILVNLLANAIKFTPEGGAVGLQLAADEAQQQLRFTVWDTGIGIADEHLPNLFKPFVQLDSRLSRQYEGTGLGLALVARLTELHGGTIEVNSMLGQGSRFTVVLPTRGDLPALQRQDAASAGASHTSTARALREPGYAPVVLLAEDNEATVSMLADYLIARGYSVECVRNGRDAVAHAQKNRVDLILMDIQMPEMDGLEAIRCIRADPAAKMPIIALTALAMAGDRERCLQAGANDYLSKPVQLSQLITVMEQQLDRGA